MADDTTPEIQISTRPFLGELFAPTQGDAEPQIRQAQRERVRENSHLLAAATGRPHLHAVEADEAPSSVTPAVPEAETSPQLRTRREEPVAVQDLDNRIIPAGYLDVDWAEVAVLTQQLAIDDNSGARPRHTFEVATASAGPETAYERKALVQITEIVRRHAEYLAMRLGSDHAWGELTRAHYVQAIFDTAFRYGRLQQYLREGDVEDLSVVGHDNVMVTRGDGTRHQRPPIADNDDDLERMIAGIAESRGRAFARPGGHIDLDIGGARLSATAAAISEETTLTVRKHNLVDVDLDDLVASGMLTGEMAALLTAAVKANLTILVAGYPGTGKTTFLRALSATLPWEEKLVSIETERELYLNRLRHRHSQVEALQYIPAQFAGSDATAVYSLADCFNKSLRSSAQRILMGEMRGPEAVVVIKVMQAGKGAMSTVHARSADDAIHRFADMLMGEQHLSDDTVPLRQILRSVDLIVYLDMLPLPGGKRRRLVTEIAEVIPQNSTGQPMAANLFAWDWDGAHYTRSEKASPQLAQALRRHDYDPEKAGIR